MLFRGGCGITIEEVGNVACTLQNFHMGLYHRYKPENAKVQQEKKKVHFDKNSLV